MGVDLFFTLSGFLITGILLDTRDQPHFFRNFYARRALRIFPLYYGLFLVLFLLTPFLHLQWRMGHLAYLFYAGNIAYNLDPSLAEARPGIEMLHFWSLAVEEQFYFIWPVLILAIRNRTTLIRTCLGLATMGLILRMLLIHWSLGPGSEWAYAELPTHMDGLLAGALAAIWFRAMPLYAIVNRVRWILPAALVALIGIVAWSHTGNFNSPAMTTVGYPTLAAFFACVLLLALKPGTVAAQVGDLSILRFFGKYSYGMYIFHFVFAPTTARLQRILQSRLHSVVLGGLAYVFLVFLGTILISVLSYNIYEKQWLRLKSRFSSSSQEAKVTVG
jgi:peptidoglycan/LPS O-acetylase OafA/YrhL